MLFLFFASSKANQLRKKNKNEEDIFKYIFFLIRINLLLLNSKL